MNELFLIAGLALVAFILYRLYRVLSGGGSGRILCDSCNANSPRYCHLPIRGRATACDEYSPRGGRR